MCPALTRGHSRLLSFMLTTGRRLPVCTNVSEGGAAVFFEVLQQQQDAFFLKTSVLQSVVVGFFFLCFVFKTLAPEEAQKTDSVQRKKKQSIQADIAALSLFALI